MLHVTPSYSEDLFYMLIPCTKKPILQVTSLRTQYPAQMSTHSITVSDVIARDVTETLVSQCVVMCSLRHTVIPSISTRTHMLLSLGTAAAQITELTVYTVEVTTRSARLTSPILFFKPPSLFIQN
jgi:hypothetical protein